MIKIYIFILMIPVTILKIVMALIASIFVGVFGTIFVGPKCVESILNKIWEWALNGKGLIDDDDD